MFCRYKKTALDSYVPTPLLKRLKFTHMSKGGNYLNPAVGAGTCFWRLMFLAAAHSR